VIPAGVISRQGFGPFERSFLSCVEDSCFAPDGDEVEFCLREIYFAREVEMALDTEGATVELGCADFEKLDELLVEIGEARVDD
jgi:hypothetical protein